jgi:aspartyl-tRNA(Asn)/glutamyl-tRNA(Gln) amidotransferase subunit A
MTVLELGRSIRQREISCVGLMQQTIAAIEAHDHFNSFITRTFDDALKQAAQLDEELAHGHDRGPFHGIPIAHKDLFYTRGVPTTAGSPLFKNFVPDFDGDVVANLKAAGAVSVGKTNLHELAYGITCNNPHYGPVLNPRDPQRMPGGSSGGSGALVAAGLLPVATGTDSGGSIRIPASYCGVTGIKPTYDLVSRRGILPLNYGLDHAGPIGSCVADCALALNAMTAGAKNFNLDPLPDLQGIRVGVPHSFFFDRLHPDVETAIRGGIDRMGDRGAQISDVTLPDFNQVNAAARVVQMAEAAALYVNHRDESQFGKDVWANLQDGRQIFGHEYVNAQRLRGIFRRAMDKVWTQVDILVTPTTAITAPLRASTTVDIKGQPEDVRLASTKLVRGWNYLGEPAISLPFGQDSLGLPVGMQLIAAPFADALLLQLAKSLEAPSSHH